MVTTKKTKWLAIMPVKVMLLVLVLLTVTFTVAEANAGFFPSIDDIVDSINELRAQLGVSEDDAFAGYYYNGNTDSLIVAGYGPNDWGSESAQIEIIDSEGNSVSTLCQVVNQDSVPEFYSEFDSVSSWDSDVYYINVDFYKSTNCGGDKFSETAYAGEFSLLAIKNLQDKVSDLESSLDDLNSSVQDDIDAINGNITLINNAISNLSGNVNDLNTSIGDLENQVSSLEDKVEELKASLSVGTINLRYRASEGLLDVWGKAPQGATSATLKVYDEDYEFVKITMNTLVKDYADFENSYKFTQWNSNSVNISSLDAESYNIEVTFANVSGGNRVSGIFTNLELEGINESISILESDLYNLTIAVDDNTGNITALWNDSDKLWIAVENMNETLKNHTLEIQNLWNDSQSQWIQIDLLWQNASEQWNALNDLDDRVSYLEAMLDVTNHGSLNLNYNNNDVSNNPNTLRVWGEAPLYADNVKVVLKDLSGNDMYSFSTKVITLGSNNNSYEKYIDLTAVEKQEYNVVVRFYKSSSWMSGYNLAMPFDALEGLGVELTNLKQNVHLLGNDNTSEIIRYSIKTDESYENATIVLRSVSGDNFTTQVLRNQDIKASQKINFEDNVFLTQGDYELEILIEGTNWKSDSFSVSVDNFPENGALITSPEENWFNLDYYYPNMENPFVNYSNIYWHSFAVDDSFDLELSVYDDNNIQDSKWWYAIDGDVHPSVSFYNEVLTANATILSSTLKSSGSAYDFSEEGIYNLFTQVEFDRSMNSVVKNSMILGIDNTNPVINNITPNEGFYSRNVTVTVDTQDELSGIKLVTVELMNNETSVIQKTDFNDSSEFFQTTFDSIALNLTDGLYTAVVTVFDNAGNSIEDSVNFTIDNTAPVINITEDNFYNQTFYEGDVIFLKAEVSDELAGVNSVWLEFDSTNITCELTQVSGNDSQGFYETSNDCRAPFYNGEVELNKTLDITVYADDNAIAENIGNVQTNITLIDPILNFTESFNETLTNATSCINIDTIIGLNGNEWIRLNNTCNINATANLTLALDSGEETVKVPVPANTSRTIFAFGDLIITPQEAQVTNASYSSKVLEFTADGNGTQEVVIYVGSLGEPEKVYFSETLLSSANWTYVDGYVYATVTYGSPHSFKISWITPSTHSGGGGGGSHRNKYLSFADEVIEEEAPVVEEIRINTSTPQEEPIVENRTEEPSVPQKEAPVQEEIQPTEEPNVGLGGYITANTPTVVGSILGLLIIGGIIFYVFRKKRV